MVDDKKLQVVDHVVNQTLRDFDDLKKNRDNGEEYKNNYEFELARDRKANIILKGVLVEVHIENTANKKLELQKKLKQLKS